MIALYGAPGSSELILIFVAVLLLFGAKRLPSIARNMGKALEEFRRAARDVTDEIMRAESDTREAISNTFAVGDDLDEEEEYMSETHPGPPEEESVSIDEEIITDDEPAPTDQEMSVEETSDQEPAHEETSDEETSDEETGDDDERKPDAPA